MPIPSGLSPDFLADGAAEILDPQNKPKLELVRDTVEGDKTPPRQVAQAAPATPSAETVFGAGSTAGSSDDKATQYLIEKTKADREATDAERKYKEQQSAAAKAQYAKVYAQYEPQLNAPAPKFEAPKETFTQLAGLGMMMMMLGSMAGGKTYGSAIGAMNGLAGMMKGYQEGRKESYDRAKTEFEESLKAWKENKAQVKEAFERALKLGPKDISKATAQVVSELTAKGETTVADLVKKNGLPNVAQAFNQASNNADRQLDAVQSTVARLGLGAGTDGTTGVALAGDIPPGTRLTKADVEAKKRAAEDAAIPLEAAKLRKTLAPSGGEDYQWIKAGGKLYHSTKAQRDAADKAGISYEFVSGPSKIVIGQQIGGILSQINEDAAKQAIKDYEITEDDRKKIPSNFRSINLANKTAEFVASHPDAIGLVSQIAGKIGEPSSSIYKNLKSLISSKDENAEEKTKEYLFSEVDKIMDQEATKDPSKANLVSDAKVAAKMLFTLALADAVAVGRPTVFLERSLSKFYSPNVTPETLIRLIKERAEDAEDNLPPWFQNENRKKPLDLLTMKDAASYISSKQPKPPAAPAGGSAETIPQFADEKQANEVLKSLGKKPGEKVKVKIGNTIGTFEVE